MKGVFGWRGILSSDTNWYISAGFYMVRETVITSFTK